MYVSYWKFSVIYAPYKASTASIFHKSGVSDSRASQRNGFIISSFKKSQLRNVQRVVAHPMFHSTEVPKQYDIMICSEEVETENASSEAITAWVAKSFCFLCIRVEMGDLSTENDDVRPDMSNRFSHIQAYFCFVQFYKILETIMLGIDAVDQAVGCNRLRCHREDAEEGRCSASKFFGIVPV